MKSHPGYNLSLTAFLPSIGLPLVHLLYANNKFQSHWPLPTNMPPSSLSRILYPDYAIFLESLPVLFRTPGPSRSSNAAFCLIAIAPHLYNIFLKWHHLHSYHLFPHKKEHFLPSPDGFPWPRKELSRENETGIGAI